MPRLIFTLLLLCTLGTAASAQTTKPSPIPSLSDQSRARTMIRTIYKDALTKTTAQDRRTLAKEWLKQAADTHDDPAAAYILLLDSADLAANAGDASTAITAAATLQQRFDIPPPTSLDQRKQLLLKTNTALTTPDAKTTPADFESLSRLALQTSALAAQADNFPLLADMTNLAEGAANKTLQVRTVSAIQPELARLRNIAAEYDKLKPALARLAADPSSPTAPDDHLVLGKFYALNLADWPRGLLHLSLSSDLQLRTLATKELALTSSTVDATLPADRLALELADTWWDLAQTFPPPQRQNATLHAQSLYKQAQSMVQGITLTRIQSRLAASASDNPANSPALQNPAAINLLPLITPAKDAVAGTWHQTDDGLTCDSSTYATLQLPLTPPDEYDLTATFTRLEGTGPIALLLTSHGKAFGFSLDTRGESRFERINGKVSQDNPTVTPTALSNGRRYTLTIQIRKDALRALLDGKLLAEYHPDPTFKDLSRYPSWKLTDTTLPGLGAHNARVTFHDIQLVEITGKGKPTR